MSNEFYALMGRMRYISRWGLMRNSLPENLTEHSYMTAVLAHALALIRREILHLEGPDPDRCAVAALYHDASEILTGDLPTPDPDRCAVAALYHDASEILTGDLPTPIKYYNPEIKDAYKQVERIAGNRLLDMLPAQLRASYEHLVLEDEEALLPFVKAADKLSAHIKCLEEQKAGNTEFDTAAKQTWESMKTMERPELDWFLENCLGAFALNLDQL